MVIVNDSIQKVITKPGFIWLALPLYTNYTDLLKKATHLWKWYRMQKQKFDPVWPTTACNTKNIKKLRKKRINPVLEEPSSNYFLIFHKFIKITLHSVVQAWFQVFCFNCRIFCVSLEAMFKRMNHTFIAKRFKWDFLKKKISVYIHSLNHLIIEKKAIRLGLCS